MLVIILAKGKSGCPVRPPELNTSADLESKVHNLQSLEGNEGN